MRQDPEEAKVRDRVVIAANLEREKRVKGRKIMEIDTMRKDPAEAKMRDRVVIAADPEREK